jgi:2-methylisocitrate lyase-like PEP mutase family enzyme
MDDPGAMDFISTTAPAATKLRRIIDDGKAFLVCPGVYDGFSAHIALQVGFGGFYMVRWQIGLTDCYIFLRKDVSD